MTPAQVQAPMLCSRSYDPDHGLYVQPNNLQPHKMNALHIQKSALYLCPNSPRGCIPATAGFAAAEHTSTHALHECTRQSAHRRVAGQRRRRDVVTAARRDLSHAPQRPKHARQRPPQQLLHLWGQTRWSCLHTAQRCGYGEALRERRLLPCECLCTGAKAVT